MDKNKSPIYDYIYHLKFSIGSPVKCTGAENPDFAFKPHNCIVTVYYC